MGRRYVFAGLNQYVGDCADWGTLCNAFLNEEAINGLNGKVATITEGARGTGPATAMRMARAGAAVVITDISDQQAAAAASALKQEGRRAIFKRTDVSKRDACNALLRSAIQSFVRIGIGFNNAAISGTSAWTVDYGVTGGHHIVEAATTEYAKYAIRVKDSAPALALRLSSACEER